MNVQYSSSYKAYNKVLPDFLWNRPRDIVTHCMGRISAAEEIQRDDITVVDDVLGMFEVAGQSQKNSYKLQFGDETSMPCCACHDWAKNYLPCKHFFSIFKHFPEWKWNKLSSKYRNSSHLNLDDCVLQNYKPHSPVNEDVSTNQEKSFTNSSINIPSCDLPQTQDSVTVQPPNQQTTNNNSSPPYSNLPTRKGFHKTATTKCRDILHQIKSLTYLTDNTEVVEEIND